MTISVSVRMFTLAVFLVGAAGATDILIHPGRVDFTAAEYYLDGAIELRVITSPPFEEFLYESTDGGMSWWAPGRGSSSDSTTANVFSFAADGDSSFYYMLYDGDEELPNTLILEIDTRQGVHATHINIAPEGINAHYFAGCKDHIGAEHWIYLCVVDTDPPLPGKALMFQRSTNYGHDWFPAIDSYPNVLREPYLACGAGRHVYFAGTAGVRPDSLVLWTNRDRFEPPAWHFNQISTGGDQIESPVVAASFTPEDSLATVWCAYSRNRNNSGNWDVEYVYSTNGGMTWSGPQVLAGSPDASERYIDLKSWRSPGAGEVSIAYISSVGPNNVIYRRFASAGEPTVWSEPVRMNSGNAALGKRVRPRLCYLAGLPSVGPGVVYVGADSGGCWWSANYPGVQEQPSPTRPSERLLVTPRIGAGPFRIGGTAAGDVVTIHDLSGRVVREFNADGNSILWDGTDSRGGRLSAGVCFVGLRNSGAQSRIVLTR